MEYKELIAISKKAATEWRNDHTFYQAGTLIDSLCSALETMQAERDTALRAQQTPLDRSRWEGCEWCNKYGLVVAAFDGWSYCNRCGKPLTKEAWVELERRINDGTADIL